MKWRRASWHKFSTDSSTAAAAGFSLSPFPWFGFMHCWHGAGCCPSFLSGRICLIGGEPRSSRTAAARLLCELWTAIVQHIASALQRIASQGCKFVWLIFSLRKTNARNAWQQQPWNVLNRTSVVQASRLEAALQLSCDIRKSRKKNRKCANHENLFATACDSVISYECLEADAEKPSDFPKKCNRTQFYGWWPQCATGELWKFGHAGHIVYSYLETMSLREMGG